MTLPQNSGEKITDYFTNLFAPYAEIKIGDYLVLNPKTNKLVVVSINDNPQYAVTNIKRKGFFKTITDVTIEKL